ncbi:Metal-dependent hydrolase, beta-lactamase superfamily II [Chryseobacterium arachidis]|uniref:Metal-dependent hydrolase, beta-lactamase superfamily II n=2 Tax=Chryseobacterium arachidis TaxID=1416778 RepID=A0A1M5GYB2_9FLAO|nr:MBL fold metallo-hydrolase [Chryseobacterium arachidis]SHG08729.1 Metal-dependent hydrolase, beta-lactamase superfamily II [Chryseobacterium arachidis]
MTYMYSSKNEATIYEKVIANKGSHAINKILMGTYVNITAEDGDWYHVITAGPNGWIHKSDLSDNMGIKVFFLDVGQGDGVLIEVGKYRILVDAGPGSNMYNYLTKYQYSYLLKEEKEIHIDYVIISHFDIDHYKGITEIINDTQFTFGEIIHPGILKFAKKDNGYSTGLGDVIEEGGQKYLLNIYDDLLNINEDKDFNRDITPFLRALKYANDEGRVSTSRRCQKGDFILNESIEQKPFSIEVLAPITERISKGNVFPYWKDDGITINGHSLVLKFTFGSRTFLLGGDLNTESQKYLIAKYEGHNPFEVDVAKSCHHGSSDFSEDFMALINPYATVISSGDNEGHSHPRADAIGCAGKYSKSKRPLVYSTELARSTDIKKEKILFGMINLRCNGSEIFMSQMKEVKANTDLWDSYKVK